MKSKRNLVISCILVVIAGLLAVWATTSSYNNPNSTTVMVIAAVLFMTGVIIFVFNFKE